MEEEIRVRDRIEDETRYALDSLQDVKLGSEEFERAVNGIATLRKLSLDDSKIDMDWELKSREFDLREQELEQKATEAENKLKEAESCRKDAREERIVNTIMGAAGIAIPAYLYSKWAKKSFKFEETGIFTSTTGRNIISTFSSWIRKTM